MYYRFLSACRRPLPGSMAGQPDFNPVHVVADDSILKSGVRCLDAKANVFLGQEVVSKLVDAVDTIS